MSIDLRHGSYERVMQDVTCDSLIDDLPYSPRTHAGYRSGGVTAGSISKQSGVFEYDAFSESQARAFAEFWSPRVRRWAVLFGDHVSQAWHHSAWTALGWYVFAPIPWIKSNAAPRFTGDGPASASEWITAAATEEAAVDWLTVARTGSIKDGALPPYYFTKTGISGDDRLSGPAGRTLPGQKNLTGMRQLVRDYSRPGDVVCDATAGSGTTLIAAAIEGRVAIGAERCWSRCELAADRIAREYTHTVFNPGRLKGRQERLFGKDVV